MEVTRRSCQKPGQNRRSFLEDQRRIFDSPIDRYQTEGFMRKNRIDSGKGVISTPAAFRAIRPGRGLAAPRRLNTCGAAFLWLFTFVCASWTQTAQVDSVKSAAPASERPGPEEPKPDEPKPAGPRAAGPRTAGPRTERADSAYILLSDSLAAARAAGDRGLEARHLKNLGRHLLARRKYAEAERMLNRGRRIALQINDRADLKDITGSLSEILEIQEDYPGAIRNLRLHSALKDSLAAETLRLRLGELGNRMRSEAGRRETVLAGRLNSLEKTSGSLRKTAMTAVLIGSLLSGILALALLNGLRSRKILIRELKDANERLALLEGFKQGMIQMLAHEFANPLNGILVHTVGANDRPRRAVRQAAGQMLNQVSDVLDVERFENAEMKLNLENVLLRVPAEQAVEDVRFLAEEKNVVIHNDIVRTMTAWMDPGMVRRVMTNLLINAVKFSNPGGEVWMKAIAGDGGFIRVSMNDTGEGLTPEQRGKIFDKFGQVESRHTGKVRSTGLGLVFCRYAVEALGGTLAVQSEPGRGTSFEFTLPKAGSPSDGESSGGPSSKPGSGLRKRIVLSVSDRKKLKPVLKKLKASGIEDLDRVRECLKRVDGRNPELKRWKEAVEAAAFECDEERFKEMIET